MGHPAGSYPTWKRDNAFGQIEEPILKHTKTILQQDALVAHRGGLLVEPA